MTTYGSTNDYISISTAISGSGSTVAPATDIVYLFALKLRGRIKFGQKITELPLGGSYSNKTGKYGNEIQLTDCVLINPGGGTGGTSNTNYFDLVKNLLSSWQLNGHAPVYMIANSDADSGLNLSLSFSSTGTALYYCKGYITDLDWEPENNLYYIRSLTFKECLT